MRQLLAWAMDHDPAWHSGLAVVLAWWSLLRGRLAGQSPLLRQIAERAVPSSGGWRRAVLARGGGTGLG